METNEVVNEINQAKSSRKNGSLLQQIGLNMVMIGVLALLGFTAWNRFFGKTETPSPTAEPIAAVENQTGAGGPYALEDVPIHLTAMATPNNISYGIARITNINTIIPSRPRVNVITYTVQTGDTLFSIAQNFSLKPETILWGNYEVLNDNPHFLKPNQVLSILPTNGTYYEWQENDTVSGVADYFGVESKDIIDYPGNFFDLSAGDPNGGLTQGTWLIVPGGKRETKDWGPPAITRENAAAARYYGEGACGAIYEGAVGTGTFVWPSTDHSLSGYTYDSSTHPAIDIGGQEGNSVFATDSGVIVYAGWSDYGYGNLIVIDHGNGWQSAYAHLSSIGVGCGQSVYQGSYIGALGNTGNSSGPHLHFELSINGVKVNAMDYTS